MTQNNYNKGEFHARINLAVQSEKVLTPEERLEIVFWTEQYLNNTPPIVFTKIACKVHVRVHILGVV